MKIQKLNPEQVNDAIKLLQQNNLPVDDLPGDIRLFGIYEGDTLIGVSGIELYGHSALLRSLCVDTPYRSQGMAEILTEHLEQFAKKKGAQELYLLTTTAENYFKRKGFVKIDRSDVPPAMHQCSELSQDCPAPPAVLKKNLALG